MFDYQRVNYVWGAGVYPSGATFGSRGPLSKTSEVKGRIGTPPPMGEFLRRTTLACSKSKKQGIGVEHLPMIWDISECALPQKSHQRLANWLMLGSECNPSPAGARIAQKVTWRLNKNDISHPDCSGEILGYTRPQDDLIVGYSLEIRHTAGLFTMNALLALLKSSPQGPYVTIGLCTTQIQNCIMVQNHKIFIKATMFPCQFCWSYVPLYLYHIATNIHKMSDYFVSKISCKV